MTPDIERIKLVDVYHPDATAVSTWILVFNSKKLEIVFQT